MRIGPLLTRRFLIAVAGSGFLSRIGFGQTSPHHRIALLSGGSENDGWRAFREAMRDHGYGEDELQIEARWAEGHNDRLAELARELVQLAPEVIVTGSSAAALAAREATRTIPIVSAFTADPVGSGLATTLARPGGNVTGLSNLQEDTTGKELELLKAAAPAITRVAIIANPTNPSHPAELEGAQKAATALGLEITRVDVRAPGDIGPAFSAVMKQGANALVVLADPLYTVSGYRIAELAANNRLPAIYGFREHVLAGGLMSCGPDLKESFRRAAIYVDKILQGAKPADLPFEQPTKFELVVNLKTAAALSLTVPLSLLARADEVIE